MKKYILSLVFLGLFANAHQTQIHAMDKPPRAEAEGSEDEKQLTPADLPIELLRQVAQFAINPDESHESFIRKRLNFALVCPHFRDIAYSLFQLYPTSQDKRVNNLNNRERRLFRTISRGALKLLYTAIDTDDFHKFVKATNNGKNLFFGELAVVHNFALWLGNRSATRKIFYLIEQKLKRDHPNLLLTCAATHGNADLLNYIFRCFKDQLDRERLQDAFLWTVKRNFLESLWSFIVNVKDQIDQLTIIKALYLAATNGHFLCFKMLTIFFPDHIDDDRIGSDFWAAVRKSNSKRNEACACSIIASFKERIDEVFAGEALVSASSNGYHECVKAIIHNFKGKIEDGYEGEALSSASSESYLFGKSNNYSCIKMIIEKLKEQISPGFTNKVVQLLSLNGAERPLRLCVIHLHNKIEPAVANEALKWAAFKGHYGCVKDILDYLKYKISPEAAKEALAAALERGHEAVAGLLKTEFDLG